LPDTPACQRLKRRPSAERSWVGTSREHSALLSCRQQDSPFWSTSIGATTEAALEAAREPALTSISAATMTASARMVNAAEGHGRRDAGLMDAFTAAVATGNQGLVKSGHANPWRATSPPSPRNQPG
jgi:hypothetical protein